VFWLCSTELLISCQQVQSFGKGLNIQWRVFLHDRASAATQLDLLHTSFCWLSLHYVWSRESIVYNKGYLQRRKKEYSGVPEKVSLDCHLPLCGCVIVSGWVFQWDPNRQLSSNTACCFNNSKTKKVKLLLYPLLPDFRRALLFGRVALSFS
jgi:hypothetical protein